MVFRAGARTDDAPGEGMARELGQGIVILALTGSSVSGLMGILSIASRALGR